MSRRCAPSRQKKKKKDQIRGRYIIQEKRNSVQKKRKINDERKFPAMAV